MAVYILYRDRQLRSAISSFVRMETTVHANSQHEYGQEDSVESDLPGFRFRPTEQELVGFYLKHMIQGKHFDVYIIGTLELYRYDPWELPSLALLRGEREWFFFVRRDYKMNGGRPSRIAVSGYWKATGSDREVRNEKHECIGHKKTLVFYTGRAPRGHRTDWLMNEYRMSPTTSTPNLQTDAVVVCRIYRKATSLKSLDLLAARSESHCCKSHATIPSQNRIAPAELREIACGHQPHDQQFSIAMRSPRPIAVTSDLSYSAEENCIDGAPWINSVEDVNKNSAHIEVSSQVCMGHLGTKMADLPFMEDDVHRKSPQGFSACRSETYSLDSFLALTDSNSLQCSPLLGEQSEVQVPKFAANFCNEPSLTYLNSSENNSRGEPWAASSNIVCNLCCHSSSVHYSIYRSQQ